MPPTVTAETEQILERTAYNRDERFVAKFYGVDVETVRGWRKKHVGPPCRKINGKLIRYALADLISWGESQPTRGTVA